MFDNLPGAGKPLGDLGAPRDENFWLRQYLMREGLTGAAVLPPALALRKQAEELPALVAGLTTETEVRAAVRRLNARILDALKKPSDGPSMTQVPVDEDRVVLEWKLAGIARREADRSAAASAVEAEPLDQGQGTPPRRRRRLRLWSRV